MTQGDLKDLIRNVYKNDIFDFAVSATGPILDHADRWQEKWTTVFRQILRRIKKVTGYDDAKNKDGKYMPLPINDKESMVIFYEPPKALRYLIYDFKIIKNNHI